MLAKKHPYKFSLRRLAALAAAFDASHCAAIEAALDKSDPNIFQSPSNETLGRVF